MRNVDRILISISFYLHCHAAAAKSLQSCLALCNPIDGSPPGSPVPGILQARTQEWVAISFSSAWKWKVKVKFSVRSDSQQPHGLQPTRLLHPWDFPGKSTGVGCHCLLHPREHLLLFSQNNKYHNSAFLGTDILKKFLALVNEEAWISIFITVLFVEAVSL